MFSMNYETSIINYWNIDKATHYTTMYTTVLVHYLSSKWESLLEIIFPETIPSRLYHEIRSIELIRKVKIINSIRNCISFYSWSIQLLLSSWIFDDFLCKLRNKVTLYCVCSTLLRRFKKMKLSKEEKVLQENTINWNPPNQKG